MARGYFCLSLLTAIMMYVGTQCMAENRWISHPSQTTTVKEGSNVTLTWRYVLSNKPERITFGLWESSYIKKKLFVVTQSGRKMVNALVKGRLFFEGTLANLAGYATIKILSVSLQDSKAYGFEISTGLRRSSFEHSFELLVYTYPASPRIIFQETINLSVLRLLWQQPKAHSYPVTKYTVWIRRNQSRWKTSNTTLRESLVPLWGDGWYEFGVTAWNRWGQSPLQLKANNTVTISRPTPAPVYRSMVQMTTRQKPPQDVPKREDAKTTSKINHGTENRTGPRHTTYQTSTLSPTTSIKSEEKTQSSMKGFFERFMTHILILVVITILVACGVCVCVVVLRRRRKKTQGKTSRTKKRMTNRKQRRMRNLITSQMMYKETSTLTLDKESDEVPEELTPFTKFEVPCTLHDNNVLPTMKTFGHRNNSVKSSSTNQVPTDEGGVHIYQEVDGAQGPPLPPRNSIKKKQESISRNKSSGKRSKSTSSSMSGPSESDWEVTPESVHLCHRIGAGSFGQVWKGILEGKHVAVKMLNERATRSDKKDLLSELEVMKTLKPHPNVVRLNGCITRANVICSGSVFDPPLVFLELVPYGDLLGYLRKSRGEDDDYYNDKDLKCPKRPTPQHLFSFAHDVAKGMAFLAENKIVHRDLAARNVLIGDRLRCKITDFGMARTLHDEDIYTKRSNGLFPVKWMAIESLLFQRYTTYSDVWSYGVVLYEIFTLGGRPYAGMNGLEVVEMIKNGKRLPKPPHVYSKLYSLMLQCWSKNPNHRPDFASLCRQIPLLAKDHQKYLNLKEYDHRLYVNVSTLKGK